MRYSESKSKFMRIYDLRNPERVHEATLLHRVTLHCITLNCDALHYIELRCTVLHCASLGFNRLHRTALHRASLHCNAISRPWRLLLTWKARSVILCIWLNQRETNFNRVSPGKKRRHKYWEIWGKSERKRDKSMPICHLSMHVWKMKIKVYANMM